MALSTARMVKRAFVEIEKALKRHNPVKTREQMFADTNVDSSSYYRYRTGVRFSPTVEQVYRLARFADLPFSVRVGAYTESEPATGGPKVAPHLALIEAALVDLSESDIDVVVKMVERYAAMRRNQPSGTSPARVGSRVAKAR